MLTRRILHFLSMALQTLIAICAIGVAGARGQGLGNFLSTFSGTHFVTPRAYQVSVGGTF
jgi:hypothetical protein